MFTTLQVNPNGNSFEEVELGPSHSACTNCRAKKLKCIGDKEGCTRCQIKGLSCQYAATSGKGSRSRNIVLAKANDRTSSTQSARTNTAGGTTPARSKRNSAAGTSERTSRRQELTAPVHASPTAPGAEHEILDADFSGTQSNPGPLMSTADMMFTGNTYQELDVNMFDADSGLANDFWGDLDLQTAAMTPTYDTNANASLGSRNSTDTTSTGRSRSTTFSLSANTSNTSNTDFSSHNQSTQSAGHSPKARQWRPTYPSTSPRDLGLTTSHSSTRAQESAIATSTSSCQCLKAALSLFEAIQVQNITIERPSIARTLRLNKQTLARCKGLLQCERCSAVSSFVLLLITISQSLVDAYERIIRLLTQQFNEQNSPACPASSNTRSNDSRSPSVQSDDELGAAQSRIKLYEYEFDFDEEPAVFGGVTRLQLTILQTFLKNIRQLLHTFNWQSHMLLVDATFKRIKSQLDLFGVRPGRTRIFDVE